LTHLIAVHGVAPSARDVSLHRPAAVGDHATLGVEDVGNVLTPTTGLGVSVGTVEGTARVVTSMADAELDVGDILVTAYTTRAGQRCS
jgi:hypothetical protein